MDGVIKAQNLTKAFDGLIAVDGVTFEVKRGEIFGFLGPNGAGKTTTARMLTGIIKPDHGELIIMGFDMHKEPLKAKQNIGVVPETSNAYVDLSAWQNLILMSELYGISRKTAEERSRKLLEKMGLYQRKDDPVKGFSKGMKQRLILAMALVNDPELLFLDEPTSGLDVQSTRMIRDILQEFPQERKTIFLTTHNMEEASFLCDRVAIINHGKIAAIDRPEKLKNQIKNLHSVKVSFDQVFSLESLTEIPHINNIKKEGDNIIISTDNVNDLIKSLNSFSESRKLKIMSLNTMDPSLEEVFIQLTGEGG